MKGRTLLYAWVLFLAAVLAGCDLPFETARGGSGTETTGGSKVVGRVVYEDGTAAQGAVLAIRRADFLPDTVEGEGVRFASDAVAGKEGGFAVDSIGAGEFVLEVRDSKGFVAMQPFRRPAADEPYTVADVVLRKSGALQGALGRIAGSADRGWVRAFGLQFAIRADAEGRFLLGGLPAGALRFRANSSRAHWGYAETLSVAIQASRTAAAPAWEPQIDPAEDYSAWPQRRTVSLQHGPLDLTQDVEDFPLSMRLDARHLDFQRATGRDLRFSDAAGRHLPYWVERWDSSAAKAVVWVRIPLVRRSAPLDLSLHWGKADAPDRSDAAAVFPAFSGVWHLSEPAAQVSIQDVSPVAATGTALGNPPASAGVLAGARSFAGAQAIRSAGHTSLRPSRTLTLSAWIRATGMDTLGSEIASMGDNYGLRLAGDGDLWMFAATDATPAGEWRICSAETRDLRDGQWHHVAGTYDGASMRVFVDGLERASVRIAETLAYPAGTDFWIGRHGDGKGLFDFRGDLDEVQASPVLRSPEWIRLSEATQRPGSLLVEIR